MVARFRLLLQEGDWWEVQEAIWGEHTEQDRGAYGKDWAQPGVNLIYNVGYKIGMDLWNTLLGKVFFNFA